MLNLAASLESSESFQKLLRAEALPWKSDLIGLGYDPEGLLKALGDLMGYQGEELQKEEGWPV